MSLTGWVHGRISHVGPTARPFADERQPGTYRSSISMSCFSQHLCMMLCLVANILVNHIEKRMTDRKGSIAGLPLEIRRTTFHAIGRLTTFYTRQMAGPLALRMMGYPLPSPLGWARQTSGALPLSTSILQLETAIPQMRASTKTMQRTCV